MLNHFVYSVAAVLFLWWLSVGFRILFEDRDAIIDSLLGRWGESVGERVCTILLTIMTLLIGPIMLAEGGLR